MLTCWDNMKKSKTGREETKWIRQNSWHKLTRIREGRFLPTDGNQLATWLPESTWATVWSQDTNEAEGKVEAVLPTV